MCFSAQVMADYRKYVRKYGAKVSYGEFLQLLARRLAGERIYLPKALTDAFKSSTPTDEVEAGCRDLVLAYEAAERPKWEAELFAQLQRKTDAERKLAAKFTKTADKEVRTASNQVARAKTKLDDLSRATYKERDDRIYSGWYAPVMVKDSAGQLVVRPMRYLCRIPGVPASFDVTHSGCFNARRDNLTKFWKKLFGHTHAVVMASAFLEHVDRHRAGGRDLAPGEEPQDVVIKFAPSGGQPMQLAALWSHWKGKDKDGRPEDLLSFALITDEPPPEVAAAGHDRCPIPLQDQSLRAWLSAPTPADFQSLLDDRERPYYDHELAAAA